METYHALDLRHIWCTAAHPNSEDQVFDFEDAILVTAADGNLPRIVWHLSSVRYGSGGPVIYFHVLGIGLKPVRKLRRSYQTRDRNKICGTDLLSRSIYRPVLREAG